MERMCQFENCHETDTPSVKTQVILLARLQPVELCLRDGLERRQEGGEGVTRGRCRDREVFRP
jgi:hypothetical protein